MNSPASTSNSIENAICAVVSAPRKRTAARPPPDRAASTFMASAGLASLTRHAGARPNTTTVTSDAPAANSIAVELNAGASPVARPTGSSAVMSRTMSAATPKLARPPIAMSTNDSVSSCRTSQPRLAPSDARVAISPARAAPRASSRFAMFTQTISSTSTVTPSSSVSGRSAVAGRVLWPWNPG